MGMLARAEVNPAHLPFCELGAQQNPSLGGQVAGTGREKGQHQRSRVGWLSDRSFLLESRELSAG